METIQIAACFEGQYSQVSSAQINVEEMKAIET